MRTKLLQRISLLKYMPTSNECVTSVEFLFYGGETKTHVPIQAFFMLAIARLNNQLPQAMGGLKLTAVRALCFPGNGIKRMATEAPYLQRSIRNLQAIGQGKHAQPLALVKHQGPMTAVKC